MIKLRKDGDIISAVISHETLRRITISQCELQDIAIHGCIANRVVVGGCVIDELVGLGIPPKATSEFTTALSNAEGSNIINRGHAEDSLHELGLIVEGRTVDKIATWLESLDQDKGDFAADSLAKAIRRGVWRAS